ncbi:MAG: GNAT family N-acetyltransferase [Muribaculaceae bacterium]|nr:GNAT family N-acetyltransferase [Muribaculaceae bacterium]
MKSKWEIRKYRPEDSELWDRLVADSRQGTLLHMRGYMDYHADRFEDCSLIALRNGLPTAILPANIDSLGTLHSHQGLTYGGWLTPPVHFDGTDMLELFDAWTGWCRSNNITKVIYKATPHIYHRIPAEEDIYALFRSGVSIRTVNLSSVVDMREIPSFNTQQKRNLKKASTINPWIRETTDTSEFMPLLEECLRERHDAAPVHSRQELQLLKNRFPKGIRMWLAGSGPEPEAAVCIYDTNSVAHCQYIATSPAGRKNGTLAYLFHHLIHNVYTSHRYFDFGTSNEDAGHILNSGLIHQKTGLGGRGTAYTTFEINLTDERYDRQ